MNRKILTGVLVAVIVGGIYFIYSPVHQPVVPSDEAPSEAIVPIEINVGPKDIPSGILEVNDSINVSVNLETHISQTPSIRGGKYSGKLVLVGKNVSPSRKVLWQGVIRKNLKETYQVKVTPHNKASFLRIQFLSSSELGNLTYPIIENKPNATPYKPPEGVSQKEGYPAKQPKS